MRTQEYSRNTDSLGRYYTSELISELLIHQLPHTRPKAVLDLGSGQGALCIAASSRWSRSSLITVDVDTEASDLIARLRLRGFRGKHAHLRQDALAHNLPRILASNWTSAPEVGICNPPFLIKKWLKAYGTILEDVGLSGCLPTIALNDVAVLFLAQNLRMIAPGGSIGIIVPDSLVNAEKYRRFRTELLSRYAVSRAIRLPRGAFGGTDALAHIIVVSKHRPNDGFVDLLRQDNGCHLTSSVRVDLAQAAERLDHDFHSARATVQQSTIRLATVCTDLRRGSLNSAQARQSPDFVLHTTDITEAMHGRWINLGAKIFAPPPNTGNIALASSGDILVARVGRTAASKVFGIKQGTVAFTDCLFRVRVPAEFQQDVLANLTSAVGQNWLEKHGYGVAAKQITKTDLLNLPLLLP